MQEFALFMSFASTAIAGLFAYLQSRDKLRYDADIRDLRAGLIVCDMERAALKKELAAHVKNCDAHKG